VGFEETKIGDFLEQVVRVTPTLPAGGTVGALAGALAAALGEFVAALSLKKEAHLAFGQRLQALRDRLAVLRAQCLGTMDQDVEAYEALMRATRMPDATRAEKVRRGTALGEAWIGALSPPVSLAKCGLELLRISLELVRKGYPVARADAGVAAELAHACARAGLWIARANMHEIGDSPAIERQRDLLDVVRAETEYLFDRIKDEVG